MNDIILNEKRRIVSKIIELFNKDNINIYDLCNKLYLSVNDFESSLRSLDKSISYYLEILDIITEM